MDKDLFQRKIERERLARKEAEKILEQKAVELFEVNQKLKSLNADLEQQVEQRTLELKSSEWRFRSLVESASDIIFQATPYGICTYINPSVARVLGYTDKELIGKHFSYVVAPESQEEVAKFYKKQFDSKKLETYYEFPVLTKHNRKIWVGQRVHLSLTKDERIKEITAVTREITERKLADELIRRSEEKYRGIIENMHLGLLEVDNQGVIKEVYDGFCKMTGFERQELEGKRANEILLPPTGRKKMEARQESRKANISEVYELQLKTKSGKLIWVLTSAAPTFDNRNRVSGSIGVHMNITDQKKLEKSLIQAKLIAEKSQRVEQEFLANMSHEIRTPLNSIVGISELLSETKLSKEQREYVDVIVHSSGILQNLISDILDISKIQSGNLVKEERPFNLAEVLQLHRNTFAYKLQEKQIKMMGHTDESIVNFLIGDSSLLNQVLINLIGNAAKFTSEGEIELTATVQERSQDKVWIKFDVRDTGIGIDEDALETIFDSFKQGGRDINRKYGGTGLGLAISKRIVELQDGEIGVQSKKGKGSMFSFTIPYIDSGVEAKETKTSSSPREDKHEEFKGLTFLAAEDNPLNQEYLTKIFNKWAVNLELAIDGEEAIKMAEKKKYDIILMDIQMPKKNGYETTEVIRNSNGVNSKTPIVALTATALLDERKKALAYGMNWHLSKPFTPKQLSQALHAVLNKLQTTIEDHSVKDNNSSVVNLDQLERLYEGDIEFMNNIIEMFLKNTPEYMVTLKENAKNKNWSEVAKIAHKCKPTFAMVGLMDMEKKAASIETLGKEKKNITRLVELIDELAQESEASSGDLIAILKRQKR